ncbi:DNA repair protein RadA [Methylopila turkensis]|uniref:DNA repair protein RadA n=1 Tax=Methylopila turkensis TaxID=1437816 RepID=A0A9W6JMV8_9HYPH|nr:DNA repair protein RadA [Methylopila turkensis]GLK80017.1 DNA repair protein RadA [Methylopila turkensis]
MARLKPTFVCQACGAVTSRWAGKCEACGAWNAIVEEAVAAPLPGGASSTAARALGRGRVVVLEGLSGATDEAPRLVAGLGELDRVTGGGFVHGSALLLGGEPGIGKSTLLLQGSAALARAGHRVVYVSGEEAAAQVRLRAQRLGLADAPVALAAETNVEDILATLKDGPPPRLVIIDSIQTLWTSQVEAAPGTVTQVRAAAQAMIRYAKTTGACVILVGHVTKDGQIAGPRVVEHMVDAVLSFEGDSGRDFRILRAQKNRFGPTDEIGVFAMTGDGLEQVTNPSALFLGDREPDAPGAAVLAGLEGSRPILVEIQALVVPSTLGTPRRAVVGWDNARLAMVLAVLEARCGVRLGGHDVHLAVAGGLRIQEPAADLAVAAALVSSLTGAALPVDAVFFGEIGLTGAVRPVSHPGPRLREAARLGFKRGVLPAAAADAAQGTDVSIVAIPTLDVLVARLAARADAAHASRQGA